MSLSKSGGITKTITLTKQTSKAARGLDDLEDAADSEGGTLEARAAAGSRFLCPVCGPDAKPSRRGLFDTLGFGKRAVLYCGLGLERAAVRVLITNPLITFSASHRFHSPLKLLRNNFTFLIPIPGCPAKKTVTVTMSSGTVVPTKTDAPSPPGPPLPTPGTGGIIRGLVYYDVNKDGKISAGEPPIAERWLFVRGPDGSILARAKTAKDGSYQLRTGKFFKKTKLSLTLLTAPARPVAYFITGSAGNADVIVGLRPPTYRGTLYVSMGGPKNTRGRESGTAARRAALASGSTALQDIKAGDIPLANQVVALRFMNGSIWKKVTTDSYGEWSLETRKRYPYLKLVATAMNGKVQRPFRADGNGYTDPIDMPVPGAVIQGLVWLDADGNNQPGSSEPLAKGMTLQIRRADDGSLIKEVITNVLGKFKFSMVPMPKVAVVIYSAGGEKLRSFSTDASGNANVMVPLQAGPVPNPGTIDGILFADVNNDGVQDADEPVLPGVTIDIRTQDGTVVGTATSDANGAFSVQLTPQVNTVMEIVGTDGTVYQSFQTDATGSATVQVGVAEPPAPADSTTVKPVPTTPAPVPTTAKPVAKTTARVPATTAAPGRITATTTTISGAASKSTTTSSAAPPPPPPTLSPGATTTASATPTTQTLPSGATSTASPTPTTQTLPSGATSTDSTTVTTQTSTTEESTTTSVSSEASNVLTTVASADPTPVTLTTPVTHPAGATTSRTIVTLTTGPNGPGIVQGTVWYDINGDGSLDSDDAPYVDRLVEIRWVNGTLFTTVMTNSTGGFFFVTDQIYPGVVLHASAANGLSRTKVFTTDMNGNMQMWIPVPPGVIEGAVWNDMNSDGQQNVGETPVTNLDLVVTFPNRCVSRTAALLFPLIVPLNSFCFGPGYI